MGTVTDQDEQNQSFGGLLPGGCSERQASRATPKVVLCQHKLYHHDYFNCFSVLCIINCPGFLLWEKRRAISFDGAQLDQSDVEPSQLTEGVRSSKELGMDRKGKFLLYWITTTSISTSTSFTTTFSINSVLCTPSGANICG